MSTHSYSTYICLTLIEVFSSVRSAFVSAAAVVFVGSVVVASPASAHDRLVDAKPAAKSKSAEAVDKITLTYSANIMKRGAALKVHVDGSPVDSGEPVISGRKVSTTLGSAITAGDVKVVWRVVSSDGHPITGTHTFKVAAKEKTPTTSAEPTDTASASASPTATSSSTPTAADTTTSEPAEKTATLEKSASATDDSAASSSASADAASSSPVASKAALVIVPAAVMALGAGGLLWWRRR